MESQIEDHRTTYCEGEVRDFVDLFIKNELETSQQVDGRCPNSSVKYNYSSDPTNNN